MDTADDIWETRKEFVRQLYLNENHTLEEVTKLVNEKYGIHATESDLEHCCTQWRFHEGPSEGIIHNSIRGTLKRDRNDGENEIGVEDVPATQPKKVKNATSLDGDDATGQTPDVSTPFSQFTDLPTGCIPKVSGLLSRTKDTRYMTNCLPFTKFISSADLEADLEADTLASDSSTSIISSSDLHADITALFNIPISEQSDAHANQYIPALMPEGILSQRNNLLVTRHSSKLSPAINFLELTLFMVSNSLCGSTTKMSKKLYKLTRSRKSLHKGLLEYFLSIGGTTSEALAEQIFNIALENNDVRMVKTVLKAGLDPNELRSGIGWMRKTPLHRAAEMRSIDLVRVLIKAGARADNESGPSMLGQAIWHEDDDGEHRGHVDIKLVELLIKSGAEVSPKSQPPLMDAATLCHVELVGLLLAKGADPNFREGEFLEDTPLTAVLRSEALIEDIIATVQLLVQAGADVNANAGWIDQEPTSALTYAIRTKSLHLVQVLLDEGAQPTEAALLEAVKLELYDTVQVLLDCGAQVTCKVLKEAAQFEPELVLLLMDSADDAVKMDGRGDALTAAIRYGIRDSFDEFSDAELPLGLALTDALQNAVKMEHISIIHSLLERTSKHRTIVEFELKRMLVHAISGRCNSLIDLLLDINANLETPDSTTGRTPLLEAIFQKDLQLTYRLLEAGAAINFYSSHKYNDDPPVPASVLPAVVCWGQSRLVRDIIAAGADVDAVEFASQDAKPALTIAIESGDSLMVQLLLDAGADVNTPATQRNGCTALVAAISQNDVNLVHRLLELGAEPNEFALIAAAKNGAELTQVLLTARSLHWRSHPRGLGCQALRYAAVSGKTEVAKLLLKHGVSPNHIMRSYYETFTNRLPSELCADDESPFATALRYDRTQDMSIVKLFLQHGADVEGVISDTTVSYPHHGPLTALHLAVQRKIFPLVELLMDAGADVNSKPNVRVERTPLQAAVEAGSKNITKLLLDNGADVNAPPFDQRGATALQFAAMKGFLGIAMLLVDRGANPNAAPAKYDGRTALEGASEHGRVDIVQLLLSVGASVVGPGGGQYERAVDLAAKNGHVAVRRLLERTRAKQVEIETTLGSPFAQVLSDAELDLGDWTVVEHET